MKTVTYSIYPLLETEKQKIDHRNLKRALFDDYDRLTTASKNLGIGSLAERFDERNEQEKYELSAELIFSDLDFKNFRVLFGEKGMFLKYNKSLEFQNVLIVIKLFEKLVDFAKLYLYTPIGKAYYSDGVTYIRNDADIWSAKRANVRYELFNEEEQE